MRLKYIGEYDELEKYGYKKDKNGHYYKRIFFGAPLARQPCVNTVYIVTKKFITEAPRRVAKEREIINIGMSQRFTMNLEHKDIKDLVSAGLVVKY